MIRRARRVNWAGIAVIALVLVAWELSTRSGLIGSDYFPSPGAVASAIWSATTEGSLLHDLSHTLEATVYSTGLALVIGTVVGVALGLAEPLNRWLMPSLDVLRTVPLIAIMPVALLIWGPATSTEVIVATYAGTWPILINTAGGVRSISPRLFDVSATFNLSRLSTLRKVLIPAAMPAILVGARLAAISSLVVVIIAEILVNAQGLGWGMVAAQSAIQPDKMWGYAAVCGVIGYLLNVTLTFLVNKAVPGSGTRTA